MEIIGSTPKYAKNWAEVFKFITTAKNYEKHNFTPNGELFVNDILMPKTLRKRNGNLIFRNASDEEN